MFDSLTHGEDLFEILIEGANPYADGPLTDGERDRLLRNGQSHGGRDFGLCLL